MKFIFLLILMLPSITFANSDFEQKTFYCKIDNAISILNFGEIETTKYEDLEIVFFLDINLKDKLIKVSENIINEDEKIKYSDFLNPNLAKAPFIIKDLLDLSNIETNADEFLQDFGNGYNDYIFAHHSILNSVNFVFNKTDGKFSIVINMPDTNYLVYGSCTSFK